MKAKFLLALVLALSLALSVTPAFAQGLGDSGKVCAGGNTTINSGQTIDSLLVFGCNATVRSGATISGDVAVFGGNLTLESGSRVNGDVALFGGSVEIDGTVNGDVAIAGGSAHLASTAVVNGAVRVAGGSASPDEGATIRGGINRENEFTFTPSFGRVFVPPVVSAPFGPGSYYGVNALGWDLFKSMLSALALAALGALLVVFFPQPTQRVMTTAQGSFGPSFGVGCLTLIVAVIIFIPLFITLVGPFLLVIAVAAAWIFGWIAIGYLAGEKILEALKVNNIAPILAVVVGVLVLAAIGLVPCLGGLISLLIGTLGVGAVVLTRFGTQPYPYSPAWAPAGPVGPLPPGPMTPAPVPVQPTPPAPTQTPPTAAGESKPNPEAGTSGEGEPQI